jgi:hypothetical protein
MSLGTARAKIKKCPELYGDRICKNCDRNCKMVVEIINEYDQIVGRERNTTVRVEGRNR